jgi:hypothetical protein
MTSMTRSRLRRVAKEYVRPGVHIADLHSSLVDVQDQRTLWTRYAKTERHPSVPTGLAEINSFYKGVQARLEELSRILRAAQGTPDLPGCELDDLEKRLADLAADRETLEALPERTLLLDEMREHGLGELLEDLAAREVDADRVASELELAWWQSALEAMISGDDFLAMSDGNSLRRLEAEFRLADTATSPPERRACAGGCRSGGGRPSPSTPPRPSGCAPTCARTPSRWRSSARCTGTSRRRCFPSGRSAR